MRAFLAAITLLCAGVAHAQTKDMTFFLTSANPGKGGDLGGLAGADRHCQMLARAAGAGQHVWRAYLSTTGEGGGGEVNARDRIGKGPWYNARGVLIARNVEELHAVNHLNKQTALTERGEVVPGDADGGRATLHDILTGTQPDGRAFPPGKEDITCHNWTSSGKGSAMVGHHDRIGGLGPERDAPLSWNSAHPSRGCSMADFKATGSGGLFYCFAAK